MVLSTTAALATTASASQARTYTTNRDPHDVAIGDFNCDGHNDIAVATDGTHTISVLWNDGNGGPTYFEANYPKYHNKDFIHLSETDLEVMIDKYEKVV